MTTSHYYSFSKLFLLLLICWYSQKCLSCFPRPRTGKVITTLSGKVRGSIGVSRDGREFDQFLKIPFAQPPLGPLRFAIPKPVQKWEGILDGRSHGPWCAHLEPFSFLVFGEEDCLHLNIHVPKIPKTQTDRGEQTQLLPVIVWIHGGTFLTGSAVEYGAEYFMDENLILISINYRLGLLGFLTTADKEIRGNMGLKDQVQALKWIKKNIQFFGGDPSKITIMGESAGAVSVHLLTLSSRSRGLFQKAISMSGVATASWACQSSKISSRRTKKIAAQLHCPTENSTALAQCLREISFGTLLKVLRWDMENLYTFDPTKEGDFLPPVVEAVDDNEAFLTQTPFEIVRQGEAHRIPWMAGIVADEGLLTSMSFIRNPHLVDQMDKNWDKNIHLVTKLGTIPEAESAEIRKKIRNFYFSGNNTTTNDSKNISDTTTLIIANHTILYTDALFLSYLSQTAAIQRQFSPVYLYLFNRTGGPSFTSVLAAMGSQYRFQTVVNLAVKYLIQFGLGVRPKNFGVSHVDDIVMLFPLRNFLKISKNDQDQEVYKFSKKFVNLIAQFVGDETSMTFEGMPFPPNVAESGKLKYFNFNDNPHKVGMMKEEEEPFENRLQFWKELNIIEKHSDAIKNDMVDIIDCNL